MFAKLLRSRPPRSWHLAEFALLPLRLFLGVTFLFAGLQKIANPGFFDPNNAASIHAQLIGASTRSPIKFLLQHLVERATLIGWVTALAEVAIGVGTLLGLWSRLAALGGFVLSVSLFLTISFHASPYYTGSDIVFAFAWLPLVIAGAGSRYSLDGVIARRVAHAHNAPEPDVVAVPFSSVQYFCGNFDAGRCKAKKFAPCEQNICPVIELERPTIMTRRRPDEVDRRTVVAGAAFAGAVAVASAALAGASAAIGRAIGNVKVTSGTHTLKPSGSDTTTTNTFGTAIGAASAVPVGGSANFTLASGDPGLVIQPTAGQFVAYDAVCTHAGCTVGYYDANKAIVCPCHASIFQVSDGTVVSGPAPTGLTKYTVTAHNGQLYIK